MNKVEVFDPPMCCSTGVCGRRVHGPEGQEGAAGQHGPGIESYAWIINQSFAGGAFRDPVLVERGSREERYVAEVRDRLATRFAVIPWKTEAPVGPDRLRELAASSPALAGALKG